MSEENVELARRAILGWNERGVDALVEVLDPEIEWHPPRESMEPGIYRGHDGVRNYLGRLRSVFEEQHVESVDVTSVDDEVVLAIVRIAGTSAKFGKIDAQWAWLITIRDGRAIHVATFVDQQAAERVAGLRE
jgi:ketosteroid isomerase-like protein